MTTPDTISGPTADRTDGSLVRLYRAGHEDAATSLYLRYAARLRDQIAEVELGRAGGKGTARA